ncbi:MAG TPA: hypothetical protein PKA00_21895, partial [Saprospiraceae bacterium]|nr:hypothetical protein [Saprospiraceae bacterium]HMQ85580.1 hypothetical protein [Saprospiraceae bacterium]
MCIIYGYLYLSVLPIVAQNIYTTDTINLFSTTEPYFGGYHIVDTDNCSYASAINFPVGFVWHAMALPHQDTVVIYIESILDGTDPLFSSGVYSQALNQLYLANRIGYTPNNTNVQAACSDYGGRVYFAGSALSVYDSNDGSLYTIGTLPDNMHAGGDLTYREGRLYLTTLNNDLVYMDMQNPMNSEIVHSFPDSIALIEGLATLPFTCDSIVTYAFATDSILGTTLYLLDFDDYSLTTVCDLLPNFHHDAATDIERFLPPCEIYTDLDMDDSSSDGNGLYRRLTCAGPTPVCDADVEVFSPFLLDSMRISLINPPDALNEKLFSTGAVDIAVQGNNTGSILLVNTKDAKEEDFETALYQTLYQNDAPLPTLGDRTIVVSMYSSFYESMPVTGIITLDTLNTISLSIDEFMLACAGGMNAMVVLEGMSGIAPYTFTWPDGLETAERNDLGLGIYEIILKDAQGCQQRDTITITAPDALQPEIDAVANPACPGEGVLSASAVGGTAPYIFFWSNGTSGDSNTDLYAGNYTLSVTDANGCLETTQFELTEAPVFSTLLPQTICQGETLFWEGQLFDSDTLHCVTYTSALGCDSTLCLELNVISRLSEETARVCPGEVYAFGDMQLTQPGVYRDTLADGGLCDSIRVLSLDWWPQPEIAIAAEGQFCTGESVVLRS